MTRVSPERFLLYNFHDNRSSWQDSDLLVHVENIRLFEKVKDPTETMDSREYKIGPVLQVNEILGTL